MSLLELQSAVTALPPAGLDAFLTWLMDTYPEQSAEARRAATHGLHGALADWDRPEEDAAWAFLQPKK